MASAKGRGLSVGIFCGASPSGGGGSALRSKQTPPSTLCRFDRRILCARGKYGSFSSLYRMMEGSAMLFLPGFYAGMAAKSPDGGAIRQAQNPAPITQAGMFLFAERSV